MAIDLRAHGLRDAEFELITVDEADVVGQIVQRYAAASGRRLVAVAIEDSDDDLDLEAIAATVFRQRHHVHFHRRQLVAVTVDYAGRPPIERDFRPNKRLKSVFDWAVGKGGFDFNPVDAAELVLAVGSPPSSWVRVDVESHVGDLAAPNDRLKLWLVPKSFFQG